MIYDENCQLGFQGGNTDIMYAYEKPEEDGIDEVVETNYHNY